MEITVKIPEYAHAHHTVCTERFGLPAAIFWLIIGIAAYWMPWEILLMISSIRIPTPKVAEATTLILLTMELTNSIEILMQPDWIAIGVPRVAIILV